MDSIQKEHKADQSYINKFNHQQSQNARYVCTGILFALLAFSLWDIGFLGASHDAIYPLLFARFAISLPLFVYIFVKSYQAQPVAPLHHLISLGFLMVYSSLFMVHVIYYNLGITLPIDSILLCSVITYFIPNIFYHQKIGLSLFIMFWYVSFLHYIELPQNEIIRAAIYLFFVNLAGFIHSLSFDKERRANFDKTQFLETMARTDQLTGTQNRHKFDENFVELLEQGKLENQGIAIAIVDIDHFKQYNDNYGHFAGDECLIKVAQALLTLKRHPLDTCIRFGGEEFILIRYGISFEETAHWGQKIINTIYDLNITHEYSEAEKRITISAGLIHWHPSSSLARTQLMTLADHALYNAKRNGRNQVQIHLPKEK